MNLIDNLLNQITMYRLMLYFLCFLWAIAGVLIFFNFFNFNLIQLLTSSAILLSACWLTNKFLSRILKVPTNIESFYITAFILILVLSPVEISDFKGYLFLGLAGFIAMASKYVVNIQGKHLFNPAGFAIVFTALFLNYGASWWIGTPVMIIPILLGGLLIIKKIKRWSLVLSFFTTILIVNLIYSGFDFNLKNIFLDAQLFFLSFVMLIEPLTSPTKKIWQITYGILVGVLSVPGVHFINIFTPEEALLIGNLFSFLVSPKVRTLAKLRQKNELSPGIFEFEFNAEKKFKFEPGQYMEWTLPHQKPDTRGNRRFFTLASSPTEDSLKIGIKFYPNGSSFKKSLLSMNAGDEIMTGQLSGEFTLPKDSHRKLVFLAGGIGVTPYRSIIKFLLDTNQERDIILFYSVKNKTEVVYWDIFKDAQKIGVKTILVESEKDGSLTSDKIKNEVPDFRERTFYISGPHGMVQTFEDNLSKLGLPKSQIKVDFFPGYA